MANSLFATSTCSYSLFHRHIPPQQNKARMTRVTQGFLVRKVTRQRQIQLRKPGETDVEYLNRITHLRLQNQFVEEVCRIPCCEGVQVVYLQGNLLKTIHCMDNFPNLTCLYLQKNNITKMEGLSGLKKLRQLHLGNNMISVLEGLDGLIELREVHVENQKLQPGDHLLFDPRCIASLAGSLVTLNISGNNVSNLDGLVGLMQLQTLVADDNDIRNVSPLAHMPALQTLSLKGNPVTLERDYRNDVIVASSSVTLLDDKPIPCVTRDFVNRLKTREVKKVEEPRTQLVDPIEFASLGSKLFPAWKNRMDRLSNVRYKVAL